MTRSVATFLMFQGTAEEAVNFYVSLFKGSEIIRWVNDRFGVSWQLNLR